MLPMQNLAGQRIVVMGLGSFGGGVGVARWLVAQQARVLVTDQAPAAKLEKSVAALAGLPIEYRLGEHRVEDFTAADLIVVNPAVKPRDNEYLRAAQAAGVALTSEIRLLVSALPNRLHTIGITGTAGKSTTTALVGHALGKLLPTTAKVYVGGNLGGSLLGDVARITAADWVVLELSSFMLEGLRLDRWSPHIAVVTNCSPNHLDWHGTYEDYQRAKQALLDFQQPGVDHAVFGPGIHNRFEHRSHMTFREQEDLAHGDRLPLLLPGAHNQMNACIAGDAVSLALGVPWTTATAAMSDYPGLPHRLQLVEQRHDVRYYNDSKSTTPDAALLALNCFPRGKVHAILGGYDKGSDLTALAQRAADHAQAIYTIGQTGPFIADAAEAYLRQREHDLAAAPVAAGCGQAATGWRGLGAEINRCETLPDAMARCREALRPGDVVLLSPGCASWGQFDNYEQRGLLFAQLARGG